MSREPFMTSQRGQDIVFQSDRRGLHDNETGMSYRDDSLTSPVEGVRSTMKGNYEWSVLPLSLSGRGGVRCRKCMSYRQKVEMTFIS